MTANFKPLIRAGLFLGMGLGGFIDGILLHQLLQTHGMLTGTLPKTSMTNIEVNMFWDGMFSLLTWTMTIIGVGLLWRAVTRDRVPLSTQCLFGSMLLGWGLFNFVEGLIDHHILHLHHVVERLGVSVYDYAFLASGLILIFVGWQMIRASRHDQPLEESDKTHLMQPPLNPSETR